MDSQQPVFFFVETAQTLISRRLCEFTVQSVAPAVIPARQNLRFTLFLALDDGVRAMPADVVESVDGALAVFGDDDVVAGDRVAQPISRFSETR